MRLQQAENLLAQRFVAVQVLDAPQHRRDVIPAARVHRNVLDGDLAKPIVRFLDCAHALALVHAPPEPATRHEDSAHPTDFD